MNKTIRAEILNLSGNILMGKANRKEIERVSSLAKEGGEFAFFQQEIKDCSRILTKESEL